MTNDNSVSRLISKIVHNSYNKLVNSSFVFQFGFHSLVKLFLRTVLLVFFVGEGVFQ